MIVFRYTRHGGRCSGASRPVVRADSAARRVHGVSRLRLPEGERCIIPAALMRRLSPIPGFTAGINPLGTVAGRERGREFVLAK
jgi:hypothetical protein